MSYKTQIFNFFRRFFMLSVAEKWLVKRTQGRDSGHIFSKLPPNHYQYQQHSMRVAERNGANYQLDLSDFVQWRTFWGIKDHGKDRLLLRLQAEDVLIDIGANIGEICLAAAKRVGKRGKVWAFEPISVNFQVLEKNLSLNPDLKDILHIFPLALGENDQSKVPFTHPRPDNRGMMRVKAADAKTEVFDRVDMRSLDNFLSEKSISKLNGIKIDVEGYELKVLKGAKDSLKRFRPWLMIEVDDDNLTVQGDSARKLLQWLEDMNYQLHHASDGRQVSSQENWESCHFDLMAVCKN